MTRWEVRARNLKTGVESVVGLAARLDAAERFAKAFNLACTTRRAEVVPVYTPLLITD